MNQISRQQVVVITKRNQRLAVVAQRLKAQVVAQGKTPKTGNQQRSGQGSMRNSPDLVRVVMLRHIAHQSGCLLLCLSMAALVPTGHAIHGASRRLIAGGHLVKLRKTGVR